jgi:hypothetical protein
MPDSSHIETRLLVVAEMLERAVAEVHRAIVDARVAEAAPTSDKTAQKPARNVGRSHVRPSDP